MNRPEAHEILRAWRGIADSYEPERVLLGEAYVLDAEAWARFFGSGSDELHLAFDFALVHADLDAEEMRAVVARTEAVLPEGAWPCRVGSNHDAGRLASRWCGGDEALARCALLVLLTLRGTPCLYYGDELALTDGAVPPARVRDVAVPSRDPCRTPMPWTRSGGWADPWLPLVDTTRNVEDQRADPGSTLHFTRDLAAARRRHAALRRGPYAELPAPPGAWAWRRGDDVAVAVNFGSVPVRMEGIEGVVEIATDRARERELVRGTLSLRPHEGAIVVRPTSPDSL
jgi:alpha-glucosidase